MHVYQLVVGLEHLQSGIEFECSGNLTFCRTSATLFLVWSLQPFMSVWRLADYSHSIRVQAQYAALASALDMPWTTDMVKEQVTKNSRAAGLLE